VEIRRVAQVVHDFKRRCFLSRDSIRIDRVNDGEIVALAEFPHDNQRVIEIAFDGNDFGAVGKRLKQFAAGDFSRGQHDDTSNPGARSVSRRRG
jgi:hypothetical protein